MISIWLSDRNILKYSETFRSYILRLKTIINNFIYIPVLFSTELFQNGRIPRIRKRNSPRIRRFG